MLFCLLLKQQSNIHELDNRDRGQHTEHSVLLLCIMYDDIFVNNAQIYPNQINL